MSYAWHQLRCAVKALNRNCGRRECLALAYGKLVKLKSRDLPAEAVNDFEKLVGGIPRFPAKDVSRAIRAKVNSLDDAEIAEAFSLISTIHDTVASYQPRRARTADRIEPVFMIFDMQPSMSY